MAWRLRFARFLARLPPVGVANTSVTYGKLKQRMEKNLGLGGTDAVTGGGLVLIALGFAVFKSQVRNLNRSRAT